MCLGKISTAVLHARCCSLTAQQTSGCGLKKKKLKSELIFLMSLKTWSPLFTLQAKWFPSLTLGAQVSCKNSPATAGVCRHCYCYLLQEMFPRNCLGHCLVPTSQLLLMKREKSKWLEFHIIANNNMSAVKSLCRIKNPNVIPIASF